MSQEAKLIDCLVNNLNLDFVWKRDFRNNIVCFTLALFVCLINITKLIFCAYNADLSEFHYFDFKLRMERTLMDEVLFRSVELSDWKLITMSILSFQLVTFTYIIF